MPVNWVKRNPLLELWALTIPRSSGGPLLWSQYRFDKIPLNDIVRVGQISLLNRDLFCVSWLLGRFCNYKCSYCWPYARSDKKDHRSTELVLSTLDEIKRSIRELGYEPRQRNVFYQLIEERPAKPQAAGRSLSLI